MEQPSALTVPLSSVTGHPDAAARERCWRWFQVIFACTYTGVLLDIVTTAMGFQRVGAAYEQNPLSSLLIRDVGWSGLVLIVTLVALVCYVSCRSVCLRLATRWAVTLNVLLALAGLVRWTAVATAVAYLMETSK